MARDDLFTRRSAEFFGPDDCCRLTLGRQWEPDAPQAAWLLCNPADADVYNDDQTCRRMEHFTRQSGCGGFTAVNFCPLRTPHPAHLWKMIRAGDYTPEMIEANNLSISLVAAKADVHVVAFGPEPVRRHRTLVIDALGAFSADGSRRLLCLGTNPGGWPLHPLARGRFAIPNTRRLTPWDLDLVYGKPRD